MADPMMMRVLIAHLLGNAWKFTAEREAALIEFGQMRSGGEPAFFVRDNGIGFDMAMAANIELREPAMASGMATAMSAASVVGVTPYRAD